MRGRGLLIAAAVLQLAGAAMALLSTISILALSTMPQLAIMPMRVIAAIEAALACGYVAASIFLLYRRRWAWIASLAANCLIGAMMLVAPLASMGRHAALGIGFGEMIILVFIAAPLYVTIGLLIGGRHAVFAPRPKTAAEPMVITPPRGD